MSELDSLLKQLESSRQLPQEDQRRQGQQALYNLQSGMRSHYGDNSDGNAILLKLEEMLKDEATARGGGPDEAPGAARALFHRNFRSLAKKEDQPQVSNIDPAKLPPAYRGRIQKYFQKLSER